MTALDLAQGLRAAFREAGLLDVDPASETLGSGARPMPNPRGEERRGGSAVAFVAVLIGALAVGIAMVFAFSRGSSLADLEPDAGRPEAADTSAAVSNPARRRLPTTASPPADAGQGDAASVVLGPERRDAAAGADRPDPSTLTAHDREELAKDAIERAERFLSRGQLEAARGAVQEARLYDAENPDIEAIEARMAR